MPGVLFTPPRWSPVNSSGNPYPGGRLTVYLAGTSVLANVYGNSALTSTLPNPVIANSAGLFPAIFLDTGNYRAVLTNSAGSQVWAEDNLPVNQDVTGDIPGPTGESGLSVAEIAIFQRADSAPGTPSGGSYSFSTQTTSPPDGWSSLVPSGTAPLYVSKAVAAVQGTSGTDADLTWSTPVVMAQDGASVDIVFKRSASQPSTPAASSGVPATWYTDVDSVPSSSDPLWSSVGTRDHASLNWIWQLPVQVEGNAGPAGADAVLYYIRPMNGTAIKNGTGSLTVEAHRVAGGVDDLITSGTIKLYNGTTEITVANGYGTGSNGYTGVFDAGDIAGSVTVTLKSGPSGTVLDTISLVDVADGTADTGKNAVYGYVEPDGPLAWVRNSDLTTWVPSGTTRQLDCTFVQGGVDVARVAWVITRDSSGILTGAAGTHSGTDLNGGRVTTTEITEGTQVMGVKFFYSNAGDTASVTETVLTSLAGATGATGATGPTGPSGYGLQLTKRSIPLLAYQAGSVVSYATANGVASLWQGATDVTAATTFSISASSNVSGATINTAVDTPIVGQPKGYYAITALNSDTGSITISAVHSGNTITEIVSFSKTYVGYEIVNSLPVTNNFEGRIVFLTTDDKLYRYTGSAWTREVDGADIRANSIVANSIAAGTITAAKIAAGSITSASGVIGNLAITNASIQNLTVGTEKFAPNSVSESVLYTWSGTIAGGTFATNTTTWFDVTSGGLDARLVVPNIPTTGGARIIVEVNLGSATSTTGESARYRIVRVEDNVVISPAEIRHYWRETIQQCISWNFIDNAPTAASHTYKLQIKKDNSGSGSGTSFRDVQLLATLYKK
jgi:hypothetical protein